MYLNHIVGSYPSQDKKGLGVTEVSFREGVTLQSRGDFIGK
jgi:hypothetical protein